MLLVMTFTVNLSVLLVDAALVFNLSSIELDYDPISLQCKCLFLSFFLIFFDFFYPFFFHNVSLLAPYSSPIFLKFFFLPSVFPLLGGFFF